MPWMRETSLPRPNLCCATTSSWRSLGGPIKKDRTFFFANYEGIRNNRQSTILASVPTAAERQGDFSALSAVLRDPATGVPFPKYIIPPGRLIWSEQPSPLSYPDPNVPGARSRNNNFLANQPITNPTNTGVLRLITDSLKWTVLTELFLANASDTVNAPVYPTAGVYLYA